MTSTETILIVGAGRGLGYALAEEFRTRCWHVIGTVRPGGPRTTLHDLADAHPAGAGAEADARTEAGTQTEAGPRTEAEAGTRAGAATGPGVEIETLDINEPAQIAALRERLAARAIDILFVNAGITTADENIRIGDVTNEEFANVMLTNALSPMRVIESLQDLVPPTGIIGAMSSGQGSIANNERGLREVYRGSKAALNMFMRSFAARQPEPARTMLVMAPGWIKTDLGGPDAPYTIEEAIPALVDVMLAQRGTPGLQYLDRFGKTVPW